METRALAVVDVLALLPKRDAQGIGTARNAELTTLPAEIGATGAVQVVEVEAGVVAGPVDTGAAGVVVAVVAAMTEAMTEESAL